MPRIGDHRPLPPSPATTPQGAKKPEATEPKAPLSTAESRARLGSRTAPGSAVAAAMLDLRDAVDLSSLAPALRQALAPFAEEPSLRLGLELILASPIADKLAVHVLSGRRVAKITDRDVSLAGATRPAAEIRAALFALGRQHVVDNALAGVRAELNQLLRPALLADPDEAKVGRALGFIDAFMKAEGDSTALATLLVDHGCLTPAPKWTAATLAKGADPVAVLASQVGLEIRPAEIQRYAAELAPITGDPKWKHTDALSNHRGMVGEALRMSQLAGEHPGKLVVQGIIVARSPPGLEAFRDVHAAKEWCTSQGIPSGSLFRFEGEQGPRFVIRETELDAAVFEPTAAGLRPLIFENVKCGTGSSGTARKQNQRAKDTLLGGDGLLLFPSATGLVDRTSELTGDYSRIRTRTVGPAGDAGYDVELPLTAGDITKLAHALRGS